MKRKIRNFDLTVNYAPGKKYQTTLVQAWVDNKEKYIAINGYEITRAQAKGLRDWLTQAMRYAR